MNSPSRRAFRPTNQLLESRILLARASVAAGVVGDVLTITGTPGPDRIMIAPAASGMLRVVANGGTLGLFGPAAKIAVDAGAGNDSVQLSPRVAIPAVIHGGAGNDVLKGGAGADLVFGDDGNDMLIGSPGRDGLDPGQGSDRFSLPQKLGTIQVGPSASGDAMRLLAKSYDLTQLGADPSAVGPMVVGAADLGDAAIVARLKSAYEAGYPVALASATQAEADQLRDLLGHQGGVGDDAPFDRADLVVYRKSIRPDGNTQTSTAVLMPRAKLQTAGDRSPNGNRIADQRTIGWLTTALSDTPIITTPPPAAQDPSQGPQPNLLAVADSYVFISSSSNDLGDQIQVVNSVWDVRSFSNQSDFYYVFQEADYSIGRTSSLHGWYNTISTTPNLSAFPQAVIQASPGSTMETTTETSSLTWSIGGSVGWNQMQGLNGAITGGVSATNSKTTVIPPIVINNQVQPEEGVAAWTYEIKQLPKSSETISFYNQWIWVVPFSYYTQANDPNLDFLTNASLRIKDYQHSGYDRYNYLTASGSVPLPFGQTFALQQPVVTSVSPTSVSPGDTFTITGTGLYPSLVTSVLIDGTPLAAGQYSTVSDTQIKVVAPDDFGFYLPVVVQTQEGESNDNVTIEINDL